MALERAVTAGVRVHSHLGGPQSLELRWAGMFLGRKPLKRAMRTWARLAVLSSTPMVNASYTCAVARSRRS